jgi:hypothetical protein
MLFHLFNLISWPFKQYMVTTASFLYRCLMFSKFLSWYWCHFSEASTGHFLVLSSKLMGLHFHLCTDSFYLFCEILKHHSYQHCPVSRGLLQPFIGMTIIIHGCFHIYRSSFHRTISSLLHFFLALSISFFTELCSNISSPYCHV